ncbi:MAG: recombinase, partial [Shewanella sp.]|nr:recombinase [Shewanella sp.]
ARAAKDSQIGPSRKAIIKWAINGHLLGRLGYLSLDELSHDELDEGLMWPLQAQYAASTVRAVWGVLKAATKRAALLKHIKQDPLAGLQFSDFIEQAITAKPTELLPDEVP